MLLQNYNRSRKRNNVPASDEKNKKVTKKRAKADVKAFVRLLLCADCYLPRSKLAHQPPFRAI